MKAGANPPLWSPPVWACFAWGLAEAAFFFIIPDVILSWASLTGVRNGVRALGAILAGALAGGSLMYAWAARAPDASIAAVAKVPFVRAKMFETVSRGYAVHGLAGMLRGPGSGIPYKVYTVLAPPRGNLAEFLALSIPARIERLALSWVVFTAAGILLRNRMPAHRATTAALFAAFWIAVYAIYWSRI